MSDFPSSLPTDDEQYLEALNRGNAFFIRGEFDAALAAFSEAIRHSPGRSLAYYSRCAVFYALGEPALGDADLKRIERIERIDRNEQIERNDRNERNERHEG